MAVVEVNGVSLAFDDRRAGEPPFVFIPGAAADRRAWAPQVDDLARDHRCISVDLRGSGETPGAGATIRQAVEDVAALLAETGSAPAILAGHSLGGFVALELARQHPDVVLGVVLADAPVQGVDIDFSAFATSIRDGGAAAIVDRVSHAGTPNHVREVLRTMAERADLKAVASFAESARFDAETMAALARAADQKPFMALWPVMEGDTFPSATEDRGESVVWLRDNTMFVRQEPVAGAGHYLQLEQPAFTNALLRAFVDDVARDPRIDGLRKERG